MISPPTHTPYDWPDLTGTQLSQPISWGPGGVLPLDQNNPVNTLRALWELELAHCWMLCVQTRDACQPGTAEPCWPVFSSVVIGTTSWVALWYQCLCFCIQGYRMGGHIGEYGWRGSNSRVTHRDGRKARDRVLLTQQCTSQHITHRGSIKQAAAHDGHSACVLYSMFVPTYVWPPEADADWFAYWF